MGPPVVGDIMGERPWAGLGGGAPCRPKCTAFILASMSCETLRPLPLLVMVEAFGRGLRAALMFPSGVEEGVILVVVSPDVETVRIAGRGGSRASGWRAAAGDGEEGDSRGLSESKSSSGVEAVDAMAWMRNGWDWRGFGSDNNRDPSTRSCGWGQRRRCKEK